MSPRRRGRTGRHRAGVVALFALPVVFLALFYAWPVIAIVARGLDGAAVLEVATDARLRRIAWFTAWQAALSTVLTVTVALVPALVLARCATPGRRVALALVSVPFVLPTVTVGAAFLALLPETLHRTVPAVLLAHVWVNLAVVVRTVGLVAARIPRGLDDAAATLGATPWRTAVHVTLPLVRPAIVSSGAVVFLLCFTSFGIVRVLGGPSRPTLEVEMWRLTTQLLDLRAAAVLAIVQILAVAGLAWWWTASQRRTAGAMRQQPSRLRRARTRRGHAGAVAVTGLTALLAAAPLAALVVRSFRPATGRWGLGAWRAVFDGPIESLVVSARFAVAAATVALAVGSCAAWAIVRGGRAGHVLDTGLLLPLGTSAVTIGFGLLITFDEPPLDLRGSVVMIPLGHALVAIPFVVAVLLPTLRAIPPGLRDAAATLGAGPLTVVAEVDVPLARRALVAGAAFAAAISLGEFGATSFLTRTDRETAPIEVARLLGRSSPFNRATAFALSCLLAACVMAVLVVVDRRTAEEVLP